MIYVFAAIAASASAIAAWLQWRTNRTSLRLALYRERKEVYYLVRDFIADSLSVEAVGAEKTQAFLTGTRGVTFLFPPDIDRLITQIWQVCAERVDLKTAQGTVSDRGFAEAATALNNNTQALKRLEKDFVREAAPLLQVDRPLCVASLLDNLFGVER